MYSRRNLLLAAAGLWLVFSFGGVAEDLGNGNYRNPVLAGDYGDPSVVRVGADYYLTHSGGGGGLPNLLVWHSRDLVNWRPIGKALNTSLGTPWAPDLIHHNGKFFIYVTLVDHARKGVSPG